MALSGYRKYKVKLTSGRVLGPLDLERIRLLVLRGHIVGTEIARVHPDGDWVDINQHVELAEILVAKAEGRLARVDERRAPSDFLVSNSAETVILPAATAVLTAKNVTRAAPGVPSPAAAAAKTKTIPPGNPSQTISVTEIANPEQAIDREGATQVDTRTQSGTRSSYWTTYILPKKLIVEDEYVVDFGTATDTRDDQGADLELEEYPAEGSRAEFQRLESQPFGRKISEEPTVLFERATDGIDLPGWAPSKRRARIRLAISLFAVAAVALELFAFPEPSKHEVSRPIAVRPRLPDPHIKPDPSKASALYQDAMTFYVKDTLEDYQQAAQRLLGAATLDPNNVKALAMLASSYLNLIDASNKDENYFSVISKLIDMSRAKGVDLPESVIADVEFFITANRPEAAQNRIIEYTRAHPGYGSEMFFYIALAFYSRGDFQNAARYIAQFPENKVYSPRIYYLRGQIAEKLNDLPQALGEYRKALKLNPRHARSHLRLAFVLAATGAQEESVEHLKFIAAHPRLLAAKELAQAYFLRAQYQAGHEKWDLALAEIERAVRLDHGNSDYLLQMYGLRARAGDTNPAIKAEAKMYYLLGAGERKVKEGKYQDALSLFQQARQLNLNSFVPPEKIGDMFLKINDVANAREAYKLAADRAPTNIEIWAKYIDTLIQSYEWEDAQKAMERFRKLPVSQSAIDKLAGDIYARQNRNIEAQQYYRKAMGRDSIDPNVYIAYAKSLMATKRYSDASFFFALALRFDPVNMEATLGTARAIAASDSIDRAIIMLQDELVKGSAAKAELLAGIAEFQIQKAEWDQAESHIRQAMEINPDYAYPWKLQAQIYLSREGQDKKALDHALEAFKSYSDRNASDPSGYLERYKIFLKKMEFEKAGAELEHVYAIYPKYPALHYFKGALYSIMGNHKAALSEFAIELKNNPQSVSALMAQGKEYLELNAPREALDSFSKAMLLAPTSPDPKHQAAWANHLLKNFQGAVALYEAALALDAANPLLYKRLGMAYRELGNKPQARAAFKKYLQMEPDASDRAIFERFL